MWIEEEKRLEGIMAPGGTPSWTDMVRAGMREQQYVQNFHARARSVEDAYDARLDAIEKAMGVRLANPMRMAQAAQQASARVTVPGFEQQEQSDVDVHAAFDAELKKLAEQRPDLIDVIKPDRSPMQDATELARKAAHELEGASDRYRGAWGTGAVARFAGGMMGLATDPAEIATMAVGPWGRAGTGLKAMTWMATKQALANAGTTAALQPVVAAWHKDAGLQYDLGTFASNVGMAGAFGFGVDFGVRGAARSIRALRGHVPILDREGGVVGWEPGEHALERAALQSKSETIRAAMDGDVVALRKLADEAGSTRDPVVRSMLDMLDDIEATSTRSRGINPHLDDEAATQAMRHLTDPHEPPPAPLEPAPMVLYRANREGASYTTSFERAAAQAGDGEISRVEVPHERAGKLRRGEVDGDYLLPQDLAGQARPVTPELAALRQSLFDGEMTTLQAAQVLRETPQVRDGDLPMTTQAMRDAHALSRLSDAAFEMVQRGQADAELAAHVARLVPDKGRHAAVLTDLAKAEPRTPGEARRMIGALTQEAERGLPEGRGIDDPMGADGQKQIASLEKAIGLDSERWKLDQAQLSETVREALDDVPEMSLKAQLGDLEGMEKMLDVLEHCKF